MAKQRNIPLECQFEVTSQCHLHCVMCLRTVLDAQRELSTDEVIDTLHQLKDAGTVRIGFTGGEIFIRPDFMDILEEADSMGFQLGLITTGTLIKDKDYARLAKLKGLDRVGVSIYSLRPKVHQEITLHDSLKASMKAVLRFKRMGMPVRVNAPIMTINYRDVRALKQFCKERGIAFVYDLTIVPTDTGETFPLKYQLGPQHFNELTGLLRPNKTGSGSCQAARELMSDDPHPFCGTGRTQIAIDAHGNIYPCSQLRLAVGNVRNTTVKDAWQRSPALQAVRDFKTTEEFNCPNCESFGGCQLCLGLSHRYKGDFTAPPAETCLPERKREKVAQA